MYLSRRLHTLIFFIFLQIFFLDFHSNYFSIRLKIGSLLFDPSYSENMCQLLIFFFTFYGVLGHILGLNAPKSFFKLIKSSLKTKHLPPDDSSFISQHCKKCELLFHLKMMVARGFLGEWKKKSYLTLNPNKIYIDHQDYFSNPCVSNLPI